jgi:hypothetical protein
MLKRSTVEVKILFGPLCSFAKVVSFIEASPLTVKSIVGAV